MTPIYAEKAVTFSVLFKYHLRDNWYISMISLSHVVCIIFVK